jgi:Zn-dependent M28 family amino/carboxypeptidase
LFTGAEHSSLGNIVNEAAKRMHLDVSPDTQPEQVFFIRSDQYSFVKQGIPAIFTTAGTKSDDPRINAKDIERKWEESVYHQPQDDMSQPFNFDAAVKYAQFNFLCGYLVAQKAERPTWNPADFFGEHYGKKSE